MASGNLKTVNTCLSFMSLILLAIVLKHTSSIMIPFVLAIFFTTIITPAVSFIQKKTFGNRSIAFLIFFSLLTIASMLMLYITRDSISELMTNSDIYQKKIVKIVTKLTPILESYGLDPKVTNWFNNENLQDLPLFSYVKTTTKALINSISNLTMIAIYLIFLLKDSDKFSFTKTGMGKKISTQVNRYLSTKVLTSSVTGISVGIVLYLFGIDMAFMFGLLSFVLNFIPTIGSIIAILLPLPIVFLQASNPIIFVSAMGIPALIQFYIGNIIEPKLMGKHLDLHPVTILLALLVWGSIWKIPGMFLATPLTVIFKIALEENKGTKFISEIMAGRWPFHNEGNQI